MNQFLSLYSPNVWAHVLVRRTKKANIYIEDSSLCNKDRILFLQEDKGKTCAYETRGNS